MMDLLQCFLKGETPILADEAFHNAVQSYTELFLRSERVLRAVQAGGLSSQDFRDVFRLSVERRVRSLPDIDGLSKAEETLKDMQDSLQQQQQQQQQQLRRQSKQHQLRLQQLQLSEDMNDPFPDFLSPETVEVSRLREEVEVLRNELQQAEIRFPVVSRRLSKHLLRV